MIGPLTQLEWQRPDWSLGLALALVCVLASLWARRSRRRRLQALAPEPHFLRWVGPLGSGRAALAFSSLGLAFAALALVGPVLGHVERAVERRGVDLVVCLDASRSMLARDERPDRLSRAKREISGLLENLKGDRVALIAFSGEAQRIAPLTGDRLALEQLLGTVDPEDFQVGGTDLGRALSMALELFDGRTGAHEAVVLVTDGEDLEGDAAAVAEQAGEAGIRVYVVGVGTREGGKIPTVDARGRESFARDATGSEVVTRLEPETLERLAQASGGEFLSTESSPTPLEELYRRRIANMEGRGFEGGIERLPLDRYQWPLAAAVLLLGLSYLVGLRRGERRRGVRTQRKPLAGAAAVALAVWGLGGPSVWASEVAQGAPRVDTNARDGATDSGADSTATAPAPFDPPPFAASFGAALAAAKSVPEGAAPEESVAYDDVLAQLDTLSESTAYAEPERALALLARAAVQHSRWRGALAAALGNPDADGTAMDAAAAHAEEADRDLARAAVLAGPGPRRQLALWERGAQGVERAEFARGLALTQASLYTASLASASQRGASQQGAPPTPEGAPARDAVVAALNQTMALYRAARQPLLDLVRLTVGAAERPEHGAGPLLEWIARRLRELEETLQRLPPEPPPPEDQSGDEGDPSEGDQQGEPEGSESEDGEPEDGESEEGDPQDGESEENEPETGDRDPGEEQERENEAPPDPGEGEQPEPSAEESNGPETGDPREGDQPVLSKEEARRLLDRLAEIEEEAQELREALLRRRRVPVTKDW
ncbi:MAG: VWA domain-containing protein [Planctomycetaceae bacterium]|nr:VWA domain-containing protein [Planctomycetaceae bacterium]